MIFELRSYGGEERVMNRIISTSTQPHTKLFTPARIKRKTPFRSLQESATFSPRESTMKVATSTSFLLSICVLLICSFLAAADGRQGSIRGSLNAAEADYEAGGRALYRGGVRVLKGKAKSKKNGMGSSMKSKKGMGMDSKSSKSKKGKKKRCIKKREAIATMRAFSETVVAISQAFFNVGGGGPDGSGAATNLDGCLLAYDIATGALDAAYGYDLPNGVSFKPTLTTKPYTLRPTYQGALSYFIGTECLTLVGAEENFYPPLNSDGIFFYEYGFGIKNYGPFPTSPWTSYTLEEDEFDYQLGGVNCETATAQGEVKRVHAPRYDRFFQCQLISSHSSWSLLSRLSLRDIFPHTHLDQICFDFAEGTACVDKTFAFSRRRGRGRKGAVVITVHHSSVTVPTAAAVPSNIIRP